MCKYKNLCTYPVRRPSDNEIADLASKNIDSITKAFQAGLISQKIGLKELRQQAEQTGLFSNITDEDIEKADNSVANMGEDMPLMPMNEPAENNLDNFP